MIKNTKNNLRNCTWFFYDSGSTNGQENMSIDECLLNKLLSGEIDMPILRLYSWCERTLSIGANQLLDKEQVGCLSFVKRITGGQAVLHETEEEELTYSIVMKYPGMTKKFYLYIGEVLMHFLAKYELSAKFGYSTKDYRDSINCFDAKTPGDIVVNDVKVIGSAQCRKKEFILQHGSIKLNVIRDMANIDLTYVDASRDLQSSFKEVLNIEFLPFNT